jgi:hypothetical protein
LLRANAKTADFAQKLAQEQWDWAKKVYDENKGLMQQTNESFLKTMEDARVASEEDRARYKAIYQPMEAEQAADARTYDTQARRDQRTGEAQANVAQAFDAARTNAQQQLESFGVNPSSTRFAGLDLGLRTQQAAQQAAAGTGAAKNVEDTARAMQARAIDVGRGYPGQYTASATLGNQAAGGAVGGTNQTFQTGAQAMGTGPEWLGGANQALGNWGNALNQQYGNQLGQFNANQSASSGWGSALGMFGGMAAKRFGFLAEGGAIPEEASPSGGSQQDDVPVAVSVGEFVVPRETVSWFGEKHFHKLTEKAEQERAESAVPTESQPAGGIPGRVGMARGGMVGLPPGERPTFPGGPELGLPPGERPGPILGIPPGERPTFPPGPIYGIPPGERPIYPGVPRGRGISMRPPSPIPHYGPDPGRGVGLPRGYPIPQNPYPAPDPGRGISMRPPPPIPHYGPDPGRGISMRPPPPIPEYPATAVPIVGRM